MLWVCPQWAGKQVMSCLCTHKAPSCFGATAICCRTGRALSYFTQDQFKPVLILFMVWRATPNILAMSICRR